MRGDGEGGGDGLWATGEQKGSCIGQKATAVKELPSARIKGGDEGGRRRGVREGGPGRAPWTDEVSRQNRFPDEGDGIDPRTHGISKAEEPPRRPGFWLPSTDMWHLGNPMSPSFRRQHSSCSKGNGGRDKAKRRPMEQLVGGKLYVDTEDEEAMVSGVLTTNCAGCREEPGIDRPTTMFSTENDE